MEDFEFEMGVLADFIGENWQSFIDFVEEHGIDEARAEALTAALHQFAGRTH